MSLEYIRRTYNVPAKRGGRIRFTDTQGAVFNCTIKSARNGRLRVLVDDRVPGYRGRMNLHPTWNVEYLPPGVQGGHGQSIDPQTIAIAAGAVIRDGESITFSVEAWQKFLRAPGVFGPHGEQHG